jgi:phosphate transport system substrate-binding protein
MKSIVRLLSVATSAGIASIILTSQAVADTLILQGSTTFTRLIIQPHKTAIQNKSGHELSIFPNKSVPGMIALMEGRAHMAMISAPIATEIVKLKQALGAADYSKLKTFEILRTRVAFVVHPSNPVRQTSIGLLRKIFAGEISNWSALRGNDAPIRTVIVGGGGGVTSTVETELLDGRPAVGVNAIQVRTPLQLITVVEQEPHALGAAQLSLVKQKSLPELTTEKPIEQILSLVTLGEPTAAMRAVIDAARHAAAITM